MTPPSTDERRFFWVQNADPKGDLGDYQGFLQGSWDDAVSVAGEILSSWDWAGHADAVEVFELSVVRSLVIKPERDDEDDDEE